MIYLRRSCVEAEQWYPGKQIEGVEETRHPRGSAQEVTAQVSTSTGLASVQAGDWVVTDLLGEKAVYDPETFERLFERPEQFLERLNANSPNTGRDELR